MLQKAKKDTKHRETNSKVNNFLGSANGASVSRQRAVRV